jgi:hypothetical protein
MVDPFFKILNVTFDDAEFAFRVKSGGIELDIVKGNGDLNVSLVPVVSVVVSSDNEPPNATGKCTGYVTGVDSIVVVA